MRVRLIGVNTITAVNLVLGFLVLIESSYTRFNTAALLISLGVALDGMDGYLARKLNCCSTFGRQFDTLADLSLFGTAMAYLVYTTSLERFGGIGLFACGLYVLCTACRLAGFAANKMQSDSFVGLPVTAAAFINVIAVIVMPNMTTLMLLVTSILMVSPIQFPHPLKLLVRLTVQSVSVQPRGGHQPLPALDYPAEQTHPAAIRTG